MSNYSFRVSVSLVTLILLTVNTQAFLCSAFCNPGSCSGITSNECIGSCPNNWILSSNQCVVDPASNLTLISYTTDVAGSGMVGTFPFNFGTYCSPYSFFGNKKCSAGISIGLPSIGLPHHSYQVIAWVILSDDTTWSPTSQIIMSSTGTQTTRITLDQFNGQQAICSGVKQTYYRLVWNQKHENQTNSPINFYISNNININQCNWGFKEVLFLAQLCHSYCLQCYGSDVSECYSCASTYYLSNNTCGSTCIGGYGMVTSSRICILCQLTCLVCQEISTNCSSCVTSGVNEAFLSGTTCVHTCPNGTFANTTDHQCQSCSINCASCNSTNCLVCDSGFGLLNNTCHNPCPSSYWLENGTVCSLCDSRCTLCSSSSSNCSECVLSGVNIAYLYGSVCLAVCPNATFTSTAPNLCINCDPKCLVCSGSTDSECSSCTPSGIDESFLLNTTCLLVCPNATFANTSSHQCESCPLNCITCSSSTVCLICDSSFGLLNSTCHSPCPNSYWLENSTICSSCDPLCSLCASSSTTCSSCVTSGVNEAFLSGTTCVHTCPNGTFANTTDHQCQSCSINCASCNSTNCLVCDSGFGLLNNTCHNPCPSSYWLENGTVCSLCDSRCTLCSSSSSNCSECVLSGVNIAYLYGSVCLAVCPNATFTSTAPNLCINCDPKCLVCSGSTDSECSSCTPSGIDESFLLNTTCLLVCPNATFANTSSHQCESCPLNCITCSSSTVCLICDSSFGLLNSTCHSPCPNSYWLENSTICSSCDPLCSLCANTSTTCSQCISSYLLGSSCLITCPNQTYPTTTPNLCQSCDYLCQVCTGPLVSECSACIPTGSNQSFLLNSTCLQNCPNTTFPQTTTHNCDPCPTNCDVCSSSTVCTICSSPFGLFNSTCWNPCPSQTFYISGLCTSCDPKCVDCFGTSSLECSLCSSTNVLSNTTCDAGCLISYGLSNTSGICLLCDPYCLVCYLTSTNCSSCVTTGAFQSFLDQITNTSYTQCVTTCPNGTFPNPSNHICDSCDTNCMTCQGSALNCTSCNSTMGWLNFTCYDPCPITYFLNANGNCSTCDPLCLQCSNSSTFCSVCQTVAPNTSYLLNNTCLTICPQGYFQDNNTGLGPNLCSTCHSFCAQCYSNTNDFCTICSISYTLSGTTCDSNCLDGYGYFSGTPQICIACTYPCLTCYESATNCSTCNSTSLTHYLWQATTANFICVTVCPAGFYHDNVAFTCPPCPTGCTQCQNTSYCYSCDYASGYAYQNQTNLCVNPCPVNFYKQNTTNCSRCQPVCRRCNVVPWNCTVCQFNGANRAFLLGNTCFPSCPSPYYGQTSSNKCKSCHINCAICFSNTKNDCNLCANGFVMSGNTCDTACSPNYGITADPWYCVTCNSTCITCSYNSTNCSSCQSTGNNTAFLVIIDPTYSQCWMVCPDGYYQNISSQSCELCNSNCILCDGSSTNCTNCTLGYYYLNFTCGSTCPDGYFINALECSLCDYKCLICQGSLDNCSVCQYQGANISYLLNNSCLTLCPLGYFTTDNGGLGPTECLLCDTSCLTCQITNTNCTSCSTPTFLNNNQCLTNCPPGFFGNSSTNTCSNSAGISVLLNIDMYFSDSTEDTIYIDINFDKQINISTFNMENFQNFSFSNSFPIGSFSYNYNWINSSSYRIILQPSGYLFIDKCTVTVTIIPEPTPGLFSADGSPFNYLNYNQTASLLWTCIKGSQTSQSQKQTIDSMSGASDSIRDISTLPYVQQINKAGAASLLFSGVQITASIIVINSMYSKQMYEASRIFSNFIYFQVPGWQKEGEKTKYLIVPEASQVANNSRLLQSRLNLETDTVIWRYQRVGFTAIFLIDCYVQLILIAFCWLLVLVGRKLQQKCKWNIMPKIYPIFHALHQLMIFYFAMGLILQLMYFQPSSIIRIISLALACLANLYLLIYTLYIYYTFMNYPQLQLGMKQYRKLVIMFGSFIRNIRYQEYQKLQKWSPMHLFRPYNYHLLSYYKKFLMILSVPMFYNYPSAQMGILTTLQLLQIVRFLLTWPYATKRRNIIRLLLQITLLLFFITSLLQCTSMNQIQKNDSSTLPDAINTFNLTGWIGVGTIILFNIGCLAVILVSLFQHCCQSNRQRIRQIRRDYYYQKIVKHQSNMGSDITKDVLDSWVVKGDLNQEWIDDEVKRQTIIRATIQRYTISVLGDGFMVQVDKIIEFQAGSVQLESLSKKIRAVDKIRGSFVLRRGQHFLLFDIIEKVYKEYDKNYKSDSIMIRTIARINLSNYSQGEQIVLTHQQMTQQIITKLPFLQPTAHKVDQLLSGFPINNQLLKFMSTQDNSLPISERLSEISSNRSESD